MARTDRWTDRGRQAAEFHQYVDEPQIYRIDHFVGKPGLEEVLQRVSMIGESMRFARQGGVEEAWRLMQPLLDAPPSVRPYAKGSWAPMAADK